MGSDSKYCFSTGQRVGWKGTNSQYHLEWEPTLCRVPAGPMGPWHGLPHSVGRMPTQPLLSSTTGKSGGRAGIRRPLLGLWLLANHLLSSSLSFHTCKTARGFQTICTDAPGLAPQTVVSVYLTPQEFSKNAESQALSQTYRIRICKLPR